MTKRAKIAKRTNVNTKATISKIINKNPANTLMPALLQYEIVWAYIKGFPSWPGVIETCLPNGKYLIHFFGDYTYSSVTRRYIVNYFEGFNIFSSHFGNIKLQKAIEEAKFFLFGMKSLDECFVCKVLKHKKQFLCERYTSMNDK